MKVGKSRLRVSSVSLNGIKYPTGTRVKRLIVNINKESQTMSKMQKEEQMDWYEKTHKHWRSWGSWFSWGSPVGLGLFFLALAGAIWIIAQI